MSKYSYICPSPKHPRLLILSSIFGRLVIKDMTNKGYFWYLGIYSNSSEGLESILEENDLFLGIIIEKCPISWLYFIGNDIINLIVDNIKGKGNLDFFLKEILILDTVL